jgi:hypothetical protein
MEAFLGLGFLAEMPWELEVHFFFRSVFPQIHMPFLMEASAFSAYETMVCCLLLLVPSN